MSSYLRVPPSSLHWVFLEVYKLLIVSHSYKPVCRTPQRANQRYPPTNQPASEQPTRIRQSMIHQPDKIAAYRPFIYRYKYLRVAGVNSVVEVFNLIAIVNII